jgi:hypothetical protein
MSEAIYKQKRKTSLSAARQPTRIESIRSLRITFSDNLPLFMHVDYYSVAASLLRNCVGIFRCALAPYRAHYSPSSRYFSLPASWFFCRYNRSFNYDPYLQVRYLRTCRQPRPYTSPSQMAITILAPAQPPAPYEGDGSSDESDNGGVGLEGDADMPPAKRARHSGQDIVTPGETVTDDPQWMRYSTPFSVSCHPSNEITEVMVLSSHLRALK